MTHDKDAHCHCVATHRPEPLELEHHHVWPTYLGGPSVPENMEWVCPTTHTNVHEIIRQMAKAGRLVSYREVDAVQEHPVSRYAFELATRGFKAHLENLVQ